MADESNFTSPTSSPDSATPSRPGATHEEVLTARLPPQETNQPDPALQLSVGRIGAGSITLVAIVCVFILAVVLYGLNSPAPNAQDVGTPPSAASAPAAGGGSGAPNAPHPSSNGH
jgi:hypothetical protein